MLILPLLKTFLSVTSPLSLLKMGGPIATPKNRTEPYSEVTNPRRSVETEPVMKLLIQGRTSPVPILLITRTEKNGINFSKKIKQ